MDTGATPGRQSTARRLVTYSLIVVGLGLTAYAVGERLPGHSHTVDSATGDTTDKSSDDGHSHDHGGDSGDSATTDMGGMSHDHGGGGHEVSLYTASSTSEGFELVEESGDGSSTFRLVDGTGASVTDYEWVHGAYLHVVMVTPDLARFEHVHPEVTADGTWELTAPDDGEWHVVFESTPAGADEPVVVTAHFHGAASDEALPPRNSTARVATSDGTELMVDLRATDTGLQFTVTSATGAPADGLEAYLEQPAHLVTFRVDDLAYVHLHPTSDIGEPVITYDGSLPADTTYRMFLQFAVNGEVVTVPFTYVP